MNQMMNHLIYNIIRIPYLFPACFILIGFIVLISDQEKTEILKYLGFGFLLCGFFLVLIEMLYYMFIYDTQNNNNVRVITPQVEREPHADEELQTIDILSINSNESDLGIYVIFDI
jgi:xanthine/uracil permease